MDGNIKGKRVAILVADGFEQVELIEPREALKSAGARTDLISPADEKVQGFNHDKPGDTFDVDVKLADARPEDYDALLLPGGVKNPDTLRMIPEAVEFAKAFMDAGKTVAAICHGPWTLIETGTLEGRKVTSYPSLRTDLINAGAKWTDEEVVVDNGLVTSRKPADIPAFNRKMIEEISAGIHGQQPVGLNSYRQQPEILVSETQPSRGPMYEPAQHGQSVSSNPHPEVH